MARGLPAGPWSRSPHSLSASGLLHSALLFLDNLNQHPAVLPSLPPTWPPAPLALRPLSSSFFAFRVTAFKIIRFVHIVSIFLTPLHSGAHCSLAELPMLSLESLVKVASDRAGWLAGSWGLSRVWTHSEHLSTDSPRPPPTSLWSNSSLMVLCDPAPSFFFQALLFPGVLVLIFLAVSLNPWF